MPRKYTMRSKEEKLSIVKQVLNGASAYKWEEQGIRHRQVQDWTKYIWSRVRKALNQRRSQATPYPDMSVGRN